MLSALPALPLVGVPSVSSGDLLGMTEEGRPVAVVGQGLSKRYGPRWALIQVSVRLAAGDSLLLLGPNGSGKTTLLKILATASSPTQGTLHLFGLDAAEERQEVRAKVGLLSHGSFLYEALSARENLGFAARILGRGEAREEVTDLLQRVGLSSRADEAVRGFSAGMRKRLMLARLLLQSPELVLIDEPYSALDREGARLVDDVLLELKNRGKTLVLATHQMEKGAVLCNRGMLLAGGRVTWSGPSGDAPQAFAELSGSP